MTRVNSSATAARARRSASSTIAHRNNEKKPYKVELKLIVAEKRQLKISNNPPPRTYSFVAAGSEAFTTYCKDLCRKTGRTIHASQSNADPSRRALVVNDPNRVGYYIGRDGFYFPKDVVQKACNWFGVRIDAAGKPTEPQDFLSARVRNALGRHGQRDKRQQIDAAVREMFPKIPPEAAAEIIAHAFESASKPGEKERVGNARNLDLASRVQLAVTAHIRHRYTNYDQLLSNGVKWHEARAMINPACVVVLRNWMGEDNEIELEETFQEWIDLRDDDENEDDSSSVEGISDTESGRRSSRNVVPTVHEAAVPSHSRMPAPDARADTRVTMYHPDPEQVLPSIESSARSVQHPGHRYSTPQNFYHGAPPPAPSPPPYRTPIAATYGRKAAPLVSPYSHSIGTNMFGHSTERTRALPHDRQAPVIDLTSSPTFPQRFDNAMPPTLRVGSLRGGEGSRRGDLSNAAAESVGRYSTRSQAARNRGDGMVPYVALQDPPPPRLSRPEPPHPAVPRTGWVVYPTFNRQGEAVRLWHLRGTVHSHEGFCRHCEDILARDTAALQRVAPPDSVPSPTGSPDVVFVSSYEMIQFESNPAGEM